MYNFAKRNGVNVTKSLVPWWMRKIYGILEDRYTNKMATSSIVPDNLSDPAVCSFASQHSFALPLFIN